jgi:hypothetical protein
MGLCCKVGDCDSLVFIVVDHTWTARAIQRPLGPKYEYDSSLRGLSCWPVRMICGTWIGTDWDESSHHIIEMLARLMHAVTEKNREERWAGWPMSQPRFEQGHPNTSLQRYRYTLGRSAIGVLKWGDRGLFKHSPSQHIRNSKKKKIVSSYPIKRFKPHVCRTHGYILTAILFCLICSVLTELYSAQWETKRFGSDAEHKSISAQFEHQQSLWETVQTEQAAIFVLRTVCVY